jgi:transposase
MQDLTLIGIDLGKHSFQVLGHDRHGKTLLRKKFSRKQLIEFFATFHACMVVMEACAGAHHMARQLADYGHKVKLISPQFVRPFFCVGASIPPRATKNFKQKRQPMQLGAFVSGLRRLGTSA